jgi:outer membrane protein assembly factor BamB
VRANCSLAKLILAALKNKGECDRSVFAERLIQQEYVNSLNCEEKVDEICFSEPMCDNLKITNCSLYFSEIKLISTLTGIKLFIPAIYNGTAPYQYTWTYNDVIFDLANGSSVNDAELFLDWKNGNITTEFTIGLKIVDANGCIFEVSKDLEYCQPCVSPTITIEYDDCWSHIGNNDYLLKITPVFSCAGLPEYQNYLSNIYISSPDISIVKDVENYWNLKVNDIAAFKALNCGDNGKIYFGKSNAREIYEYDVNTGDATFKFALPAGGVYNHPILGSTPISYNTGDGDIAVTANKIFFLNWFTAPDPTGTFPIDYACVGRYDIDWNTLALTNFTMIVEPSGVNYVDGFAFSLEAVSDDLILVDWYQGAVSGGFLPATQNEVREYDFSLLTFTTFIDTIATFNNMTGCNDIAFDGTHVYMLMVDLTNNPTIIYNIRKFDYLTKALVSSSAPISFSIISMTPPGIAVLDGKVYVAEDFGNVLVYDATTLNYLYNKDITNINIRGTVPPIAPTDAISGFGQISSTPSTNLEINYTVNYNECNVAKSESVTEDFPCDIPVCCEDCELDLDITFADCYTPHSDGGLVGGAVEVTITSNGCVNVNNIDFLTATVTDTTPASTNILKFVKISNKWHIMSSENAWLAGNINISFNYDVCGVTKNYSANFGRNDINLCCADCPEENAFTVTIADCYDNIPLDGIHIIADYTINCQGWTNSSGVTVSIRKNGVQIGTMSPYNNGYRIIFDTNDFSEICGVELLLVSKLDDCQGDPTWFYNTFTIPCELPECEPCVDCDNENEASYNLNVNDLCWSETTPLLSKYEAVIPNVFTCNGKILKVKSITVVGTNGCAYHTAMRDGIWYLTVDKTCADTNPAATITLKICWNDCD